MKLETLRSLRNFAGLPAMTNEEEAAHAAQSFSFGDASAQDEPDGRQSWYVEMFHAGGHYSVVLYSDGSADIVEGSGQPIPVNSSLGEKVIDAARAHLGIGKTFNLDEGQNGSTTHVEQLSENTTTANYISFLQDLKKKLEKDGSAQVSVKLLNTNVVSYSFK